MHRVLGLACFEREFVKQVNRFVRGSSVVRDCRSVQSGNDQWKDVPWSSDSHGG